MSKNTIRIANFAVVNNDFTNEGDCATTEENTPIVLEEKDIPGAALPRPIEQCSVAILKRWLSCRGAKVTGKKGELAQRVRNYIENGLASILVDPDGGINIAQKKLKLGLLPEISTSDDSFPSSGFETDLGCLPEFQHNFLWKFMIEDVEIKKQLSTEKPLVKGYNLFKSGHVLQLFVKQQGNFFFILSKVLPSMKKGKVYSAKITLRNNGSVHNAGCGCPAGIDGRCNHVTASLFALENYCKMREKKDVNDDLPCTSKPCKWNVPRQVRIEPTPVRHVKFVKHAYGKEKKRKLPCPVGPVPKRPIDEGRLSNILKEVKKVEHNTGKIIGLSHILPQDLPKPSTKASVPNDIVSESLSTEKEWSLTSPQCMGPLSLHEIKEKAERAKRRLFESSEYKDEIELKTKEQQESSLWYSVRQHRITASKAKRCLIKNTTSPTKAIASILQYHGNIKTKAMKEGIEWESKIISQYEYVSGNSVSKSGFVISTTHPFLGASPDGRIHNGQGVIEVKKVATKDGESFEDTLMRLLIYKRKQRSLILNTNHKYYVQIQQQMFCTGTHYCHFIISDGIWMHVDIILFSHDFWSGILSKLEKFYFSHLLPEIVYPKILHNVTRWGKDTSFPSLSD